MLGADCYMKQQRNNKKRFVRVFFKSFIGNIHAQNLPPLPRLGPKLSVSPKFYVSPYAFPPLYVASSQFCRLSRAPIPHDGGVAKLGRRRGLLMYDWKIK